MGIFEMLDNSEQEELFNLIENFNVKLEVVLDILAQNNFNLSLTFQHIISRLFP